MSITICTCERIINSATLEGYMCRKIIMLPLCDKNALFLYNWPPSDNNEPSFCACHTTCAREDKLSQRSGKEKKQETDEPDRSHSHTVSATKNTKGCPGRPVLAYLYDIPVGNFWPDAKRWDATSKKFLFVSAHQPFIYNKKTDSSSTYLSSYSFL